MGPWPNPETGKREQSKFDPPTHKSFSWCSARSYRAEKYPSCALLKFIRGRKLVEQLTYLCDWFGHWRRRWKQLVQQFSEQSTSRLLFTGYLWLLAPWGFAHSCSFLDLIYISPCGRVSILQLLLADGELYCVKFMVHNLVLILGHYKNINIFSGFHN